MLIPKKAAPVIVADLPADAGRNMMRMPDGELRLYGRNITRTGMSRDEVVMVVMKSSDDGASWRSICPSSGGREPGPAVPGANGAP